MSAHAECWLGNFYVGSTRNDVDSRMMQFFRSSEKVVARADPWTFAPLPPTLGRFSGS